jgi:hypothetical protein
MVARWLRQAPGVSQGLNIAHFTHCDAQQTDATANQQAFK